MVESIIISKLNRLVENTESLINSVAITDNHMSMYNQIKNDWNALKDCPIGWKEVVFSSADFKQTELYEKVSESGKCNMRTIHGICKDALAQMAALTKEKTICADKNKYKRRKVKVISIAALVVSIIGIMISAFCSSMSDNAETRYHQGKIEAEQICSDTKHANEMKIAALKDSLEKYKSENKELKRIIAKRIKYSK